MHESISWFDSANSIEVGRMRRRRRREGKAGRSTRCVPDLLFYAAGTVLRDEKI